MNVRKRGLALLMCICMIFTLLPFSALADNGVASDAEPSVSVESPGDNGVKLKKTVTKKDDDTYRVTLEQYVEGSVTPGKKTPIDVVLVLDVSGSMGDPFGNGTVSYVPTYEINDWNYYIKDADGNYKQVSYCLTCKEYTDGCSGRGRNHKQGTVYTPMTSATDTVDGNVQFYTSSGTKIAALKSAVNSFIDIIAKDNPTSKIAIVKFAGDTSNDIGNDTYWSGGYTHNYTQIVKNLTTADATGAAALKEAVSRLKANGATAADYGLEKAIEVFGAENKVPADRNRVVIMFTDGEPNHVNGFDGSVANNAIKNARTLKSASYGASVYTIGIFSGADVGTTLPDNDKNGRTNRYMHLVSSNYPNASSMSEPGTDGAVKNGFYKVASDANSLGNVFTQLGEAIGKPSIDLGSAAVLTDNIAPNFNVPKDAKDVKVYTVDYDGKSKTFGAWQDFTGAKVSINNNEVTVSGFDYSKNFVSDTAHPGTTGNYGKKLIVEFDITVDRTQTYGGTQPANDGAKITLEGKEIASVDYPPVPVSIVNGFSASYTNSKTYDGKGFTIENEFKEMLKTNVLADGEKNDYVNITYTVTDKDNNVVGTYVVKANETTGTWTPTETTATPANVGTYTYNVTCVVSDATENGAEPVTKSGPMTLSITEKKGLTVSGTDYNGMYDGKSHGEAATANVDGATIEYSTDNGATWTDTVPTIKDVGEINVTVKASMANYSDATAEYTLKVTPRPVTITSGSATKMYDGTPLIKHEVTYGGDKFVDGEGVDITYTGSQTIVGSSKNTFTYEFKDGTAEGNYDITTVYGDLEVTDSNKLTVSATGYNGIYDGQTHNGKVTATEGATLSYSTDGENWTATEPTIKDVGEINVIVKASMANYSDATAKYTLKVTPRTVTITSGSASKTYDGTPLTKHESTITGEGFVEGQGVNITYTGSQTEVGSSKNTFEYQFKDNTLEKNYTIETVFGTLTVEKRPYIPPVNPPITDKITVEITGNSDSVVYDGAEHSVKDYTVKISDSRYTEKDFTFSGKALASGINAGTYEMGLKANQFKNTNARFTNVEFIIKADGVLTITQRPLTITAGSAEGIAPVTCDKYTVEGLATGDKVDSVKITGIQSEPGESPNVASDAVIKNAKGEDVTANYKITYVDGVLKAIEVLNKEIHFNYVIGYTDGTIRPNNDISRAEVATIFFRLLTDEAREQYTTTAGNFTDVKAGMWCNRAIATLTNMGIIKGYTDGSFQPNKSITRAELATIIARFAKLDVNTKTFSDINGHWAQKNIELAAGNGWINGYEDGTFRPNNNITRAETFAMINRVLDRQTESVSDLLPTSEMNMWSDNLNENAWYYKDVQEATNYHKCDRVGDSVYEKWTEKVPDIDWASYQI